MKGSRLYRSRSDSVIGGVCGGLGNYLNTDPVIFRVLFAVAFFAGGSGLLAYIVLWIVVPLEETAETHRQIEGDMENTQKDNLTPEEKSEQEKSHKQNGSLWAGIILISLGLIFLIDRFLPRIDFGDLWPLILVVIGILLIYESHRRKADKEENE